MSKGSSHLWLLPFFKLNRLILFGIIIYYIGKCERLLKLLNSILMRKGEYGTICYTIRGMKKKKYLIALLLTFVVAVLSIKTNVHAAGSGYKYSDKNSESTYGYDYFGTVSNGDKLQTLYKDLDAAAKAFHNNSSKNADSNNVFVEFDLANYGLTVDEAVEVWIVYKFDHPMYYWISKDVICTAESFKVKVVPEYKNGTKRVNENKRLKNKIQGYLNLAKGETDPYALASIFQREICLSAEYKYDDDGAPSDEEYCHNIVGILREKGTVCEGYAKLLSLLLNECGVENVIVAGVAGGQNHAWNMVKLANGNWYYCDPTWDDVSMMLYETGSYNNFMKGSKAFANHEAYTPNGTGLEFLYKLPRASYSNYKPKVKPGKTFKKGKDSYIISGYKEVTLYKTTRIGNVTIPETVKYNGATYKVVGLGKDEYGETLVNGKVDSIRLPKTIRMIWDSALLCPSIKSISVNKYNKFYRSKNGILYTKNYYTLVQYPRSKKISKLVLPKNTHIIAYRAIDTAEAGLIGELVVNAKLDSVGTTNWGAGHFTKKPQFSNEVAGQWGHIARSCKKVTISKANKLFAIKNNCIIQKGVMLYGSDGNSMKGEHVLGPASCYVRSISLPKNAVGIQCNAFYDLPNIESVKFNKGLKYLDSYSFYCNDNIDNFILPEGLVFIDKNALSDCFIRYKTFHIYIPKSVKTILDSFDFGHVVIHGVKNSYAHKYAKKNGYEFSTSSIK